MSASVMIESAAHKAQLLGFARAVAKRSFAMTTTAKIDQPFVPGRFGGAFVTFWNQRRLRGCVGRFLDTDDIASVIEEVTEASLIDVRFAGDPITADELAHIRIEISVLTDPVRTDDPLSLRPGTHGIIIRRGKCSGCFLPKVATDRNWSAEEFLSNCCTMKAKLDADAWRSQDTEVLLFTAESFTEQST